MFELLPLVLVKGLKAFVLLIVIWKSLLFIYIYGQVHMCNKLASRHVRVGLANPSEVSRCDICENAPGIYNYFVLFSFKKFLLSLRL